MIDAHVHYGNFMVGNKNWSNFNEYLKKAKRLGIKSFCVTPIGLPNIFTDRTNPDNESVLKLAKENPNIKPVYWLNIFDKNIDKNYIRSNYAAVKFHPDIGEVEIDDARVILALKEIGMPVFIHTNENKSYCSLEKIIHLANKIDNDIIALHSGSVTKTFFKLFNYKIPKNLYFDTSGIQYEIILKKIYDMVGAKRIIFGSDYPFGDPAVSLERIKVVAKNEKEIKLMTEENIKRILR